MGGGVASGAPPVQKIKQKSGLDRVKVAHNSFNSLQPFSFNGAECDSA